MPIHSADSVRTVSFDGHVPGIKDESLSNGSGSFEGRRIVNMRANACKVATVFTLILIGSGKLGSLCFDAQDQDISGLTSRTYEAVNTALLIGLLTLQYTRQGGKLKNVFEMGKICSYEFFAALTAAHVLSYSFFFLTSSATKDPLSAGIYGASLGTALASYAAVYKEHRAASKIALQDAYHAIDNLPSSIDVNRSQIQNGTVYLVAKASIPVVWGIVSASFASLCFNDQNELTLRAYEAMSMGLVAALLAQQQMRSSTPLKNPLESGSLCSYEFLATIVAANTLAYSLLFVVNASRLDSLSAAFYGGTLSTTLVSYGSVLQEHVRASKKVTGQVHSFFDYNNPLRQPSVAVDDDVSLHSTETNDEHGCIRFDSLCSSDG